jgi:biopolymer transport protein ExbD
MNLKSELPAVGAALHLAPLLATVLILLIYAYLSTSLIAPSGVGVRLPESDSSLSGFEEAQIITLSTGEKDPLYLNGKRLSLTELAETLERQPPAKHRAVLYADRNVTYGRVMEISSIILSAGYQLAHATSPQPRP